jgi:hypothetical protein
MEADKMQQHSVFYYPYASFVEKQSLLLKAAALYFDKLYILDPAKASFAKIGTGDVEQDVRLLEQEKILERVAPEEVLHKYHSAIAAAIERDLNDAGFRTLCAKKGNNLWTLALAKIPKGLRQNPAFQPLDESMKRVLTGYTEVYDEYRESGAGGVEYRYGDYPFEVGEAIMLNHALVGSLLHMEAIPITDDSVHSEILNYKLLQAQQVPEISAVLANRQVEQRFAQAQLAARALTDLQLGAIPEAMPMQEILAYRSKHSAELQAVREKLSWMAREVTHQPWTKEYEDEIYHKVMPELNKALEPAHSSWSSWLKPFGLVLGGSAVVLGIFSNPLTPLAVGVAALTIGKDAGIAGLELYNDWKQGRTQNGLHYLLRLKSA